MSDGVTPWPAPDNGAATPPAGSGSTIRRRRSGLTAGRGRRRTLISLTPLIDVVFILLVFYMLASTFTEWNAIPLALDPAARDGDPAGSAEASRPQQPYAGAVLVDVQSDGLRLSGRPVSDGELPSLLAAMQQQAAVAAARRGAPPPARKVIVRPAEGVALQRMVTVMDMLSAAGVTDLALAHRGGAAGGRP